MAARTPKRPSLRSSMWSASLEAMRCPASCSSEAMAARKAEEREEPDGSVTTERSARGGRSRLVCAKRTRPSDAGARRIRRLERRPGRRDQARKRYWDRAPPSLEFARRRTRSPDGRLVAEDGLRLTFPSRGRSDETVLGVNAAEEGLMQHSAPSPTYF